VVLSYPDTYPDINYIGAGLTYSKTAASGKKIYTFTAGTDSVIF